VSCAKSQSVPKDSGTLTVLAEWLRENAPRPQKGQNYHQWLTSQYGLRKLVEHIWKVVGIASTCEHLDELKKKMEELYGKKKGFQFELKLKAGQP
jgi:hypothetical protein